MPVDPQSTEVVGEAYIDTGDGKKRTVQFLDYVPVKQI
jgi:hypothetical protein